MKIYVYKYDWDPGRDPRPGHGTRAAGPGTRDPGRGRGPDPGQDPDPGRDPGRDSGPGPGPGPMG